jgi:serine/threonine protein kinase
MPLSGGQTFAGYIIIRLLGSGGMGEVYLAQHPRLPRRDALKLLPHDWSADAEYRARFNREADLASTLWHPHIVSVHDRGEYDDQLWISMDFVDGLDAARLLADRYPAGMPVDHVVRIVTAMASALDYAHKRGLLHRDVKPANIMLTHLEDDDDEQRILLTDFGIARNVGDISGLTATNMTVGTVAYCAPEQLLGEDIDGRADQYSLAATTFHLLTGSHLFPHSNPAVVISRHLTNQPPALADKRPELAKLDPILAKGLGKRPDDRYRRCSDFARALSEQISSASVPTQSAPTSPAPVPPQRGPGDTKSLKARLIAVAAAVVALILTAALIFIWRPWERQATQTSNGSPGPLSSPTQPITTPMMTTAQPPPSFSPKAIDQVLLTTDQLTKVLGATVTSDPSAGGPGGLGLNSSSYGMPDHSGQVTPRSCVRVIFTGEHDVYAPAGPSEIKTETFGTPNGINAGSPHLVQQTAAVFPSTEGAQQLLTSSKGKWKACASGKVDATFGYESGAGYIFGSVLGQNEMITLAMASTNNMGPTNGADACQQAMGARQNVVIEVRTCEAPSLTAPPDSPDLAWAVPDAERVTKAMLENVRP